MLMCTHFENWCWAEGGNVIQCHFYACMRFTNCNIDSCIHALPHSHPQSRQTFQTISLAPMEEVRHTAITKSRELNGSKYWKVIWRLNVCVRICKGWYPYHKSFCEHRYSLASQARIAQTTNNAWKSEWKKARHDRAKQNKSHCDLQQRNKNKIKSWKRKRNRTKSIAHKESRQQSNDDATYIRF